MKLMCVCMSRCVCRHKEQLEKAREQLEKVKAAAGIEAKDDMQARIQRAQKVLTH